MLVNPINFFLFKITTRIFRDLDLFCCKRFREFVIPVVERFDLPGFQDLDAHAYAWGNAHASPPVYPASQIAITAVRLNVFWGEKVESK